MVKYARESCYESAGSVFSVNGPVRYFPDCVRRVMPRPILDHFPLLLETGIEDWGPPFIFEIMWLLEKGFTDYVKEWWSSISLSGWMGYQLTQKLKFLKKKMKCWRKDVFSSLLKRKSCLLSDIQSFDGKEEARP